jgi:type IV conjugative transfer system protein TraL
MKDRKNYPIPKYLDDTPEVIIFPVDEFLVFTFLFLLTYFINIPMLICPPIALLIAFLYHKAKEGKPKNYHMLILYQLGLIKPEGIPSSVVKEFQE